MTNAEHLIENAIKADADKLILDRELDRYYNRKMLEAINENGGLTKEDIIRMAYHIVYSLYEGLNPFDKYFEKVIEYYHFLKEQEHAPKYIPEPIAYNETKYDPTDDMSLGAMILFGHDD